MSRHSFGGRAVAIHQKGYVRVSVLGGGGFEKLISIEASSDVSKKSALGRGAGAVLTAGVNLAGSNKRGDVYLTIVTETRTHVLHADPPTVFNLKASKELEAAGQAVLRANEPPAAPAPAPARATTSGAVGPAEKLRALADLRDAELISSDEYEALSAKLLDESF